jgi:hypothetical protein
MTDASIGIERHHHITLCVGTAQEDYDFHTQVLGLKSVKKTALYDGDTPIYHLYYGNDVGLESTLVTTFPMRQSGRMGRRGTNQTKLNTRWLASQTTNAPRTLPARFPGRWGSMGRTASPSRSTTLTYRLTS